MLLRIRAADASQPPGIKIDNGKEMVKDVRAFAKAINRTTCYSLLGNLAVIAR